MKQALIIGFRYLMAKKSVTTTRLSTIAVIGIALGVSALLVVLSVTGGFESAFRERVLGVNAHVLVMKYGAGFSDYQNIAQTIRDKREVKSAAPFTIQELIASSDADLKSVLVKGIDLRDEKVSAELQKQIVAGEIGTAAEPTIDIKNASALKNHQPQKKQVRNRVASPRAVEEMLNENAGAAPEGDWSQWISNVPSALRDSEHPRAILGKALARDLALKVGDRVKLMTPMVAQGIAKAGANEQADFREFVVAAIFDAGFYEYDSRLIYVDLPEGQSFESQSGSVTGIEIRLKKLEGSKAFSKQLESELGGSYYAVDWSDLNKSLFTALSMQKLVLTLVITTIIFVAAFNVVATLIMLVLDKKREIAILKAIGAQDATVLSVFALQGIAMGALGVVFGIGIGAALLAYLVAFPWALDAKVYLIDHIPVDVSWKYFLNAGLVAMLVCSVASVVPAWWAARLSPLRGLRAD